MVCDLPNILLQYIMNFALLAPFNVQFYIKYAVPNTFVEILRITRADNNLNLSRKIPFKDELNIIQKFSFQYVWQRSMHDFNACSSYAFCLCLQESSDILQYSSI